MRPTGRTNRWRFPTTFLVLLLCGSHLFAGATQPLPPESWAALSGNWQVDADSIREHSDSSERGGQPFWAVSGQKGWEHYSFSCDVTVSDGAGTYSTATPFAAGQTMSPAFALCSRTPNTPSSVRSRNRSSPIVAKVHAVCRRQALHEAGQIAPWSLQMQMWMIGEQGVGVENHAIGFKCCSKLIKKTLVVRLTQENASAPIAPAGNTCHAVVRRTKAAGTSLQDIALATVSAWLRCSRIHRSPSTLNPKSRYDPASWGSGVSVGDQIAKLKRLRNQDRRLRRQLAQAERILTTAHLKAGS